ncbi:MAG: hypothetical protein ACRD5E_08405 [Nitrososphaeraceae archaeon]
MPNIDKDKADSQNRDLIIYELIKNRFSEDKDGFKKLDGEARSLFSSILVALGFLLAGGTVDFLVGQSPASYLLYFVGISLLIISIIFDFLSMQFKSWITVPDVNTLLSKYTEVSSETLYKKMGATMASAIEQIERLNDIKKAYIRVSWILLITGLIMVAVFFGVSLMLRIPN